MTHTKTLLATLLGAAASYLLVPVVAWVAVASRNILAPVGFALSLDVATSEDVDRTLAALAADGGAITMPAGETFWSKRFGMVRDSFGVQWMVGIQN